MTHHDARGIVRYLQDGDRERGLPCFVGRGEDLEPCRRPAAVEVYGLHFCEIHGEEARAGALEELHQDAGDFFGRLDNLEVPELSNPLVLAALRDWELTIPEVLERAHRENVESNRKAAEHFAR